MYNIYDIPAAVQNVQERLYFLYKNGYGINVVYPDGIYGTETVNAVKEFQAKQGIAESGVVDFETFKLLNTEYQNAQRRFARPSKVRIFPRLLFDRAINPGERFGIVYVIQAMLLSLGTAYDDFKNIEVNGIYDKNTEAAVKKIKNNFKLGDSSAIDKEFFSALTKLYESLDRKSVV